MLRRRGVTYTARSTARRPERPCRDRVHQAAPAEQPEMSGITQILDLYEVRLRRLADALLDDLKRGYVVVERDSVSSVEAWREAARRASRERGWRVRTGVAADGNHIWAARVDWQASSTEVALNRERVRALAALIHT